MNSTYEFEITTSPMEIIKETTEAVNWVKGQAYNIVVNLNMDMVDDLKDAIADLDEIASEITNGMDEGHGYVYEQVDNYRTNFIPAYEEAMELIDALTGAL